MAAIPAAVLHVLVNASTGGAAAELTRLDKRLKGTAATASTTGATVAKGMKYAALGVGAAAAGSVYAAAKFESAFAEVRKTVETSEKGFARIEDGLRGLSKEIPVSANELANLAGEAGALGVKSKDIVKFTKTASQLGTTTDLSATDAANAIARLSNIMDSKGKKAFERYGATLVDLGNKGASTESEITEMALRIAGAGKTLKLSEAKVLGLAAGLANVGIRAEAGGSSVSRVMLEMQDAVAKGGAELGAFAETAGLTAEDFTQQFAKDAPKAIALFAGGLGDIADSGGSTVDVLKDVNLNELRVRDTLLRLAGNTKQFTDAQDVANTAWGENNALAEEAKKRYETFESQLKLLKNAVVDTGIGIGQKLLPDLKEMVKILSNPDLTLDEKVAKLGDKLADVIAKWAPKVAEAGAKLGFSLVKGLGQAFLDSNLWGKLFIGGALIRAIGGKGALTKLGAKLGAWIAAPMMARIAARVGAGMAADGAVAASMSGKAKGLGSAVGRLMGVGLIAGLLLMDEDIRKAVLDIFRGEKLGAPAREAKAQSLQDSGFTDVRFRGAKALTATSAGGDSMKFILNKQGKWIEEFVDQLDAIPMRWRGVWGDFRKIGADGMDNSGRAVNKRMANLLESFGIHTRGMRTRYSSDWSAIVRTSNQGGNSLIDENDRVSRRSKRQWDKTGRDAVRATGGMSRGVVGNVSGMVNAVGEGYKTLGSNTSNVLQALSAKKIHYKIADARTAAGYQRGGSLAGIVPGQSTGDKHLLSLNGKPVAKVESREGIFVGNRNLMGAMEKANAQVPRFQGGGYAGVTGDTDFAPALGQALSAMSQGTGRSIYVQSGGRSMAEQQALYQAYLNGTGNLAAVPNANAPHVRGIAADITPGREAFGSVAGKYGLGFTVSSESWHIELLNAAAAGKMGLTAQKVARVMLKGPDGPLKDMGQGGLDKARKAANAYIASKMPTTTAGGAPAMSGSGDVERTFAAVAKALSTSKIATLALGMAGYAESGMQDLPGGHSSSQGALQLLASTASGLGVSPHDEKAVASLFLQRGFYGRGGANSLAAQGLPAHLVAQSVQGSAFSSGSNYAAQEGSARAWMQRYGLQKGGMLPFAGAFRGGGVVPGPIGRPASAVVHGGERITPAGKTGKIELHFHGANAAQARQVLATLDDVHAIVDGERVETEIHGRQLARMRR